MDTRPTYYSQYDKHWANIPYRMSDKYNYTIKTSGCGPTVAAMVISTLTDDKPTPVELCEYAKAHGYRVDGGGTSRKIFESISRKYGFDYSEGRTIETAAKALNDGGLVACSIGPSKWTSDGHYILLWKVEGDTVYINDPIADSAKRNRGTVKELLACIKTFCCMIPPKSEEGEDMSEPIYRTLDEVPAWGMDTVKKLMSKERPDAPGRYALEGDGNGEINVPLSMLRVLVINDRCGLYD